jgi:hypothetical protein
MFLNLFIGLEIRVIIKMSYIKGVINEETNEYNLIIMGPEGGSASMMIGDTSTVVSSNSNVAISYDATSKDAFIDFTTQSTTPLPPK